MLRSAFVDGRELTIQEREERATASRRQVVIGAASAEGVVSEVIHECFPDHEIRLVSPAELLE